MPSRSVFPDAIQPLVGPHEQPAIGDGDGGVRPAGVVLEDVVRQQLELGTGRYDVRAVMLRDVVQLAVGKQG